MTQPLQECDLIFSPASSALRIALTELKRSNLSLGNRLKSIKQDATFVCEVAEAYSLPLIANERCGSWYIPSSLKTGSAYFKSTDGHFGEWRFSLRRLNLQLLNVVGEYGGCVVVDSTRRGKSMPDALSKTIPFWVVVLNRLLFPEVAGVEVLRTPGDVVSESEHAQMQERIEESLNGLRGLGLDAKNLREKLKGETLRVVWHRPSDKLPDSPVPPGVNLIVLCTASNETSSETSATSDYVQGAADDPESWSRGLDAATFWRHEAELLAADEDELPALIDRLVLEAKVRVTERPTTLIQPTRRLFVGTNEAAIRHPSEFDFIISCTIDAHFELQQSLLQERYLTLHCKAGKAGSRQLRSELQKLPQLRTMLKPGSRILVTCESGKDLSVGVALALLCLHFSDRGELLQTNDTGPDLNKTIIKQRLSWIMVSLPDANPSRTTLQSVNSHLLG